MKITPLLLAMTFLLTCPVQAQQYVRLMGGNQGTSIAPAAGNNPVPVGFGSQPAGEWTSVNAGLSSSTAALVTFTAPSTQIKVSLSASSSAAYISINGTATNANYILNSGGTIDIYCVPAINSISILGAGSSGTYSVLAH